MKTYIGLSIDVTYQICSFICHTIPGNANRRSTIVMLYKTWLQHMRQPLQNNQFWNSLAFTGVTDSRIQIINPYYKSRILHIMKSTHTGIT